MAQRHIVQFGGINHRCGFTKCQKEADWRLRNTKTGEVVAAACKEHKEIVRQNALYPAYQRKTTV